MIFTLVQTIFPHFLFLPHLQGHKSAEVHITCHHMKGGLCCGKVGRSFKGQIQTITGLLHRVGFNSRIKLARWCQIVWRDYAKHPWLKKKITKGKGRNIKAWNICCPVRYFRILTVVHKADPKMNTISLWFKYQIGFFLIYIES